MMALAFLPHDKIEEGFNFIKLEVQRLVTSQRQPKWEKLFAYFQHEWMTVVRPQNFTVFNALARTDNFAEFYHRDLNALMGSKPDCPLFVGECHLFSSMHLLLDIYS